ncbi:MAG TPA: FUSC family protein, partial [Chthoniobacterales bacterium]|nr:FUSC family protein [Chthoniobacterales bacterium]
MTRSKMEFRQNANRRPRIWDAFVTWHTTVDSPRPEIAEGLRMAVGIFVPIVIGWAHNDISWGVFVALTTFWVLLCDTGGTYRDKAMSMAISSLAIVAAFVVGAWASQSIITHILGIFVWLSVAALLGVLGSAAAQAGLMSSTMFIVSVALFRPDEFWIRTGLCCLGALWAMSLSLALWPLQGSSPVFEALEISHLKLAGLLEAFWSGTAAGDKPINNLGFALAFDAFITQLENTRRIWGAIRARRAGPSARSIQLLRLIELLDRIGGSVAALRQLVSLLGEGPRRAEIIRELHSLTADLATTVRNLARSIPKRGRTLDSVQIDAVTKTAQERLERLFGNPAGEEARFNSSPELERTARNLVKQIRQAKKLIANLESDRDEKETALDVGPEPETERLRFWRTIRSNLSFESDGFRHALRLGLIGALGQTIASLLQLPRGYWITVTILFILKPNFGGTLQRAVLRLSGTVLGGLIAAALSLMIQEDVTLICILPVLAFVALSVRPINYGLYTLALTPMIMVMLDVGHTATWETSFLRVLHTFVGGILAVVGGYLLFPIWERQKLPGELAAVLKVNANFLRAILGQSPAEEGERAWRQLQRKAGLALANAATAGQRVLSEPRRLGSEIESSLAVIAEMRDFFHILSAITESQALASSLSDNLRRLGMDLANYLDALSVGIVHDEPVTRSPDVARWKEQLNRENVEHS